MDEIIEGAKKEGEVIIHVGPGQQFRDGRLKGFEAKYPWLKVHAINTANRESMPKLIRERQAGIYSLDVHMGGSPNLVRIYRPQGFLQPFRDAIVDQSLLDDKVWNGGFAGGFQDTGGQYIYAYNMVTNNLGHVNWNNVKRTDLKSLDDVMKMPTKIVWHDPRSPGPGFATAMAIYFSYGEEFLTKLVQQKSVFTNNRRQAAEWVVRGRYPVGLGTSRDFMVPFEQQGLTKTVQEMPNSWVKSPTMSSGNGNIVFMDKAPHPNAAKLYINWFLQKEQQQQWADFTDSASRRLDTKPAKPGIAPEPGKQYIDIFHEKNNEAMGKVLEIVRKNISAAPDAED
jgi:iron(III) transport system substrate-binding protein